MLLSTSKWILIAIVLLFAALGTLVFAASRRGWKRNGYFTIASTVLIVLGIFLSFQTLGAILAIATGDTKLDAGNIVLLAVNGVAQLLIMLGGTVLISRSAGQDPFAVFRLEGFHETPASAYLLSVPIILSAQFAGSALATMWTRCLRVFPDLYHALDKYESQSDSQMQGLVTAHGTIEFVLIFIFVALVPAFAEETLFRGFAQSNIERSGHGRARPFVALIVASILFAAIHASVFKFPGLLALGLSLGWMAYRTNNLFVGSLGHAANNGLIVIALYLKPDIGDTASSSLVGTAEMPVKDALELLAFSLPMLAVFVYLFHRATEAIDARHNADREIMYLSIPHNEPETWNQ
jgi:membrane protease YdiL (CAAX protease family)